MTATDTPKESAMKTMTLLEAINDAMHVEMANDDRSKCVVMLMKEIHR